MYNLQFWVLGEFFSQIKFLNLHSDHNIHDLYNSNTVLKLIDRQLIDRQMDKHWRSNQSRSTNRIIFLSYQLLIGFFDPNLKRNLTHCDEIDYYMSKIYQKDQN